jgi:hypothetical protein
MTKLDVPGDRSGPVFPIARRRPDSLTPRFPLLTIGTAIKRCRQIPTLPGQAGPLRHPGVHPHGRRHARAELAELACPRHALGLHLAPSGSPMPLSVKAPAHRTAAGTRFYLEQPVRRSEDSPCGKRVWKDSVMRIVTIDRFMGWPTAVGIRGFLCAGLPSDVKVVFTDLSPTPRARNRRALAHALNLCANLIPAGIGLNSTISALALPPTRQKPPVCAGVLTESR